MIPKIKLSCPECGKKHNKFPSTCYYAAMADNTHVVIARVASLGTSDQKQWAQESKTKWEAMQTYVRTVFPNNGQLKSN